MVRDDINDVNNEEFDKLMERFDTAFDDYFKEHKLIEKYVAFYIAERLKHNFLFRETLDDIVFASLNDLAQFNEDDCNYNIMKKILKEKYNLEIISDDPLDIICVDQ